MRVRLFVAMSALVWSVSALAAQAQIREVGLDAQPDATAQRIETLEQQVAALQARLGDTCGVEAVADCCPEESCGSSSIYAGAELLLLEPHVGALGGSLFGFPLIPLTPDFDTELSPRFWVGYENAEGIGARLAYWEFDHATRMLDPFAGVATITNGLEARTIDGEMTICGCLGATEVRLAGGLRYAELDFGLGLSIPGDGAGTLAAGFDGIGPTLALDIRRAFGCRGLALIGGVRGAWLYGDTQANLVIGGPVAAVEAREHMLQVWEARMGIEWSRCLATGSQVFARATYEAQAWEWAPVAMLVHEDLGFVGPAFAVGFAR